MALEAFFGLSLGYNYALARKKEAEVKQGKNDYQASVYQMQSLINFSTLAERILSQIPYAPLRTGITIGNTILPFAGIILCPASAAIKQGHYEQGVKCFNALVEPYSPKIAGILPQQLHETRVKLFSFLSENIGSITKAGVLAGTVALPFLGFGYLAAGIAGPLAFETLDAANLIPSKVSLVVEKYMPTVSNAALLVGGGLFSKTFAIATLGSEIPGASTYVQKKIEKLFFKNFKVDGPSLEEIDAPWEERNDLSFEEINHILNNDDHFQYEINPAHCSKQAYIAVNIPEDRNFKNFIELFEKINWSERYSLLKSSFRDDDRFLDLLKQHFPDQSIEHIREHFEVYLENLASESAMTKEDLLAKQLFEQMNQLVMILCQEKTPKGFLHDLQDAMDACSQILAYLNNQPIDNREAQIEKEDILLKLAIEGGDYCARGIKRTAMEVASGIVSQGLQQLEDPLQNYELQIRQQLQFMRQQIMQSIYQKMIEIMVRLAKEGNGVWISKESQTTDVHAVAAAQDVHTMDLFRQYLTLGFCPLTANERHRFGIPDFITWLSYREIRSEMYATYQSNLDQAIKEKGEIYFCNYLRQKISYLPLLSLEQKEFLIDKLAECSEGEKTLKSFHRLFFVMQGVLKIKPIYSDWVELSNEEKDAEDELPDWEMLMANRLA